ncbi:MAG: HPr family phosphocarrier protein [Desulfurococcus sp.]|nr:HPr family phosphocarrier protein [Desulfurococcus sp.]
MREVKVTVVNKSGLHARPAARFVETARRFKSEVIVVKGGKSASAKNILQVLSLGVDYGDEIVLRVNGEDEDEALSELLNLLKNILPAEDK